LIASALLLVVAALYYAATVQIPVSTLGGAVGPHVFPTVLALLLGVLGISLGLRTLLSRRAVAGAQGENEASPLRALGLLGIAALYIPAAIVLGYVPAILLLIAAIALYEGAKLSWRIGAIAAGGALFFWLLFVEFLGVRQPEGIFF
jgi:putative tricarboxylic transport membrane protein